MVLARQLPSSTWPTPPTRVRVPRPQCRGRSSFDLSSRSSRTHETYSADKQTPRRDIKDNPDSLLALILRQFAAALDPYRDQPTFSSPSVALFLSFDESHVTDKTSAIVLIFSHDATPGLVLVGLSTRCRCRCCIGCNQELGSRSAVSIQTGPHVLLARASSYRSFSGELALAR